MSATLKALPLLSIAWIAGAIVLAQPGSDSAMFEKIRAEGMDRSQVAPVFEQLTVAIGPRLTASPAHKRAAEWMRERLTTDGLTDSHLEPWKFGRGWTLDQLTIEMIEPRYLPLIGYADAWSPSTPREIVAAPVFAPMRTPEEIAALKDRLKGAIVMSQPILTNFVRKDRPNPTDPGYQPNSAAYATSVGQRGRGPAAETPQQRAQRLAQAFHDAEVGVVLKPSTGEHGTVFVTGRDNGAVFIPRRHAQRRALQHDRAHDRPEDSGEAARERQDHVPRCRRRQRVQRHRRAARHRSGRAR